MCFIPGMVLMLLMHCSIVTQLARCSCMQAVWQAGSQRCDRDDQLVRWS